MCLLIHGEFTAVVVVCIGAIVGNIMAASQTRYGIDRDTRDNFLWRMHEHCFQHDRTIGYLQVLCNASEVIGITEVTWGDSRNVHGPFEQFYRISSLSSGILRILGIILHVFLSFNCDQGDDR